MKEPTTLCGAALYKCRRMFARRSRFRMQRSGRKLGVVLWLTLCAQSLPATAQTATISGTVTDAEIGEAIRGAPVYLVGLPRVAVTTVDGSYEFLGVEAGTYVLTAVARGYLPFSDTLEISGTSRITHDFRLEPDPGDSLAGQRQMQERDKSVPHPGLEDSETLRLFELSTVCGCFKSANAILGEALRLRTEYGSLVQFERDSGAVDQMGGLLKSWRTAQQICLTRFGSKLFEDTWCNSPGEISEKRRALDSLGIAI
ncbi:MAG: carboxypeptidase-like regulatory domain-containing protein [Rhodothermaceae bacterium]|nr:carboxypeptidase-like regulatory domain-containing protein [Rhodothermaceae bacterium]MYF63136.1 carboxypeptidase-like regulatory domain-containing protein [Rhodothermaceae bacterium]MYI83897.1 carboxypeptidase-like regulatory domain-containing protein [Rhodothermaceae bacterium]